MPASHRGKSQGPRKSGRKRSAASNRKASALTSSFVGDLVNFRGLVYAPINETGVVLLFGKVAADLNMYVEEIKTGFPDCIARRFTGKGWERLAVEFEFRSSHFKLHGHPTDGCDMIVCWEHDWSAGGHRGVVRETRYTTRGGCAV